MSNSFERMDKRRLEKQWKGVCSIIEEMKLYDVHLLIDGQQKPITELQEASKRFQKLLKIPVPEK